MSYPKPGILIYMTDTETGETTVTNTSTDEQYKLSERHKLGPFGLVHGGPSNPICFVCGASLAGKSYASNGLGDFCLECSDEADYYVNSMRGRGFHGTR
jgi:hypothetical protein